MEDKSTHCPGKTGASPPPPPPSPAGDLTSSQWLRTNICVLLARFYSCPGGSRSSLCQVREHELLRRLCSCLLETSSAPVTERQAKILSVAYVQILCIYDTPLLFNSLFILYYITPMYCVTGACIIQYRHLFDRIHMLIFRPHSIQHN